MNNNFILALFTIIVLDQIVTNMSALRKIPMRRVNSSSEDLLGDCVTVINEINTGSPGIVKKNDFIELKMICDSRANAKSLQGYKLIGLSGGTGRTANIQTMTIDLVVNLWNSKTSEAEMFTIGSESVPNIDMNIKSEMVAYRNKFTGNSQTLGAFLNIGNKHIHAIALIYKRNYAFPEINLNVKRPFITIDSEMEVLIKSNLVDLLVYGRKAPYDTCEIFTNLHEDYTNKDYILREFDNSGTDRTLNRCSFDRSAFVPEKFKLGVPSPGAENDCSGPNFFIEPHLPVLSQSLQTKAFDEDNIEEINTMLERNDTSQCYSASDPSSYYTIPVDQIESKIREESEISEKAGCSILNLGSDDGNIADEIDRINRRKRRLSESTNYEEIFEWESTDHFQ